MPTAHVDLLQAMKATLPAELQEDDLSDDSDELPSDLDEESDIDAEAEAEESQGEVSDEDDEDDDALSMAEASDNEDLLPLDGDIPDGLIDFDGPNSESDGEWAGIGGSSDTKKRKRGDGDDKKRRKKLRSLPTFASYEDYAKMIEEGPEDNI